MPLRVTPLTYLMLEREKARALAAYCGDLQWITLVKTVGAKPEEVMSYTKYSEMLNGKTPQPVKKRDVQKEVASELSGMLAKYLKKGGKAK